MKSKTKYLCINNYKIFEIHSFLFILILSKIIKEVSLSCNIVSWTAQKFTCLYYFICTFDLSINSI